MPPGFILQIQGQSLLLCKAESRESGPLLFWVAGSTSAETDCDRLRLEVWTTLRKVTRTVGFSLCLVYLAWKREDGRDGKAIAKYLPSTYHCWLLGIWVLNMAWKFSASWRLESSKEEIKWNTKNSEIKVLQYKLWLWWEPKRGRKSFLEKVMFKLKSKNRYELAKEQFNYIWRLCGATTW